MTDNTTRLDHVVLWVRDPVAAAGFYEENLGLRPLRVTEYAAGTVSFPSVRLNEETILDLAPHSMAERMRVLPGADASAGHPVNHVCLSLSRPDFEKRCAPAWRRGPSRSRSSRTTPTAPAARPAEASTSPTRTATSSRPGTTTSSPSPPVPSAPQNSGSGSTPSKARSCRLVFTPPPKPPMPPSLSTTR